MILGWSLPLKFATIHDPSPRASYLRAALEDLNKFGHERLDPHLVAAKSGISQDYDNQLNLITDLVVLGFDELAAIIGNIGDQHEHFEDRLHALVDSYLNFAIAQPRLLALMFNYKAQLETQPPVTVKESGDQAFANIRQLLDGALKTKSFKSSDPAKIAIAIWSYLHGSALNLLKQRHTAPLEEHVINEHYRKLSGLLTRDLVSLKAH